MKVTIQGVEYDFVYNGFGPLYTFEVIARRPYEFGLTADMHTLIFATLQFSNPKTFKMAPSDFFQILYDDPILEKTLTDEIVARWEQRAKLLDASAKKNDE